MGHHLARLFPFDAKAESLEGIMSGLEQRGTAKGEAAMEGGTSVVAGGSVGEDTNQPTDQFI